MSRVLFLSAGITKRKRHPGGEIYLRAYPNTGALYHVDLYVVTAELPDLPAGVYHFAPHDFALRQLRQGDFRAALLEASGGNSAIARAPVVIASASTYWRNSWKYQARAWRHCFWDAGTLHANLLAVATTEDLEPRVVLGWADEPVEQLLGLDPLREGALTLVPLGRSQEPPPPAPEIGELRLETQRLSRQEVDYARDPRGAGRLVARRRGRGGGLARRRCLREEPLPAGPLTALRPHADAEIPRESLDRVIRRRGSTRAFDRQRPIGFEELSTALDRATRAIPADFLEAPRATLLDLYLIVNAVEGLAPGTYHYRREARALELLREGQLPGRGGPARSRPGPAGRRRP